MGGEGTRGARWLPWLLVVLALATAALLLPKCVADRADTPDPGVAPTAAPDSPARAGPTLEGLEAALSAADNPPSGVPAEPAWAPSEMAITGVVRDERGRAVAGVAVTMRRAGWRAAHASTDEQGRYRLEAGPRPDGPVAAVTVEALAADGRAGSVSDGLWSGAPAIYEIGTIVLQRGVDARVRVVQQGKPVAGARVVAALMANNRWTLTRAETTDAAGWARFPGLAPGAYRLLASGGAGGRASGWITLPHESEPVVLELPATGRSVVIRTVERGTGKPVAGAQVEVHENTSAATGNGWHTRYEPQPLVAPTNAEGATRIDGLDPAARLVLIVRAEGYAPPSENPHMAFRYGAGAAAAATDEVTLELIPRREHVFPIAPSEVAAPAEGSPLEIRSRGFVPIMGGVPDAPTGRVRDGHVVVSSFAGDWFWGAALTAEGAIGQLKSKAGAAQGEPVVFHLPRRARVRCVHADGSPAPGWLVYIGQDPPDAWGPATTDADGVAVLEGLWGARQRIYVGHATQDQGTVRYGDPAGELDISSGDASIEVRVGREQRVLLHVTVDGERWLPPVVYVHAGRPVRGIERDEAAATLAFAAVRDPRWPRLDANVSAPGFGQATFTLPKEPTPQAFVASLVLHRQGELVVRVLPPPDGRFAVQVQRFDEAAGTWRVTGSVPQRGHDGPTLLVVAQVQPGRLRVLDALSGVPSAEVELVDANQPPTAVLDLREVLEVPGRVEVPADTRMDQLRVFVEGRARTEGEGPPSPPGSLAAAVVEGDMPLPVDPKGRFRLRMARGRNAWIRAEHHLLEPAADGGRTEVRGTESEVVLRLVEGRACAFSLSPPAVLDPHGGGKARVALFQGDPVGAPLSEHTLELEGPRARFGGFKPGTYTLWIDAPPHAPLVRRSVVLGAGETDLGEFKADVGLSVRVTLLPADGQPAPKINVGVYREDAPKLSRSVNVQDASQPVTLSGLPPGRARLVVSLSRSGENVLDEPIDVVAPGPLERTVDLRRR